MLNVQEIYAGIPYNLACMITITAFAGGVALGVYLSVPLTKVACLGLNSTLNVIGP